MTQEQLADRLGVERRTISRYERRETAPTGVLMNEMLARIDKLKEKRKQR